MPFVYSEARKAEAVALADVMGADEAGKRLGIDPRTIRGWAQQLGRRPELDVPADELEPVYRLALARVTTEITEGKIRGPQLATVLGIMRDKLDRARSRRPEVAEPTIAERFVDALEPYIPPGRMTEAYVALIDWADSLPDDAPVTPDAALAFLESLDLDQWSRDRAARDAAYRADVAALAELSRLAHTGDLDADTRDYARAALDEARAAIRTRYPRQRWDGTQSNDLVPDAPTHLRREGGTVADPDQSPEAA